MRINQISLTVRLEQIFLLLFQRTVLHQTFIEVIKEILRRELDSRQVVSNYETIQNVEQ